MQKNLTFYTLFFKNSKNVFHIYCTKAGRSFLVNIFFLKTRTSYYMYTYMCDVSRLRHLTLYILKIKMSFLLHIGRRCLALYNVHFSNYKIYTPYQQPVLLGCGIFFHRVKNNVRCLWINSILYFFHVQQCLFNTCN